MPLYAVKNKKTGETQEFMKTLSQYEEWKKENPDWDKDWSKQGRVSVRYRQDFLRGIHGHPDHKSYGQKPTVTVTDMFPDENGHKDETYTETLEGN